MGKLNLKIQGNHAELDRLAIGGRIYDMLDLGNMNNSLKIDNGDIAIDEKDIIDIFFLVNRNYEKPVKIIKRR